MTRLIFTAVVAGVFAGAPAIAAAQDVAPAPNALPTAPAPAPVPSYLPPPTYVPPPEPAPMFGDRTYRRPGIAAALSLQPLPIDFGNLYAENVGWGIAYTAVEASLLAPMMWMTGTHMNHGTGGDRTWSSMETDAMIGFTSGYVLVKIASAVHAGYAAGKFNERYAPRMTAWVAPVREGALLVWSGNL